MVKVTIEFINAEGEYDEDSFDMPARDIQEAVRAVSNVVNKDKFFPMETTLINVDSIKVIRFVGKE